MTTTTEERRALAIGFTLGACATMVATRSSALERIARRAWDRIATSSSTSSSSSSAARAAKEEKEAMITELGLIPHPEGGFFVETYRTGATPMSSRGKTTLPKSTEESRDCATATRRRTEDADDGRRNCMTSIYYMLTRESGHQWWALNESDHVHYHHAGGRVTYHLVHADGTYERKTLGRDVANGETPQLVVKGGTYKAAVLDPGAEFVMIGEAVAPGFDFRDFSFVSAKQLSGRNASAYDETQRYVKPQPEDTFDHYYDSPDAQPGSSEMYFTPKT